MEIRVGGKYRLDKKLGSGAFGDLYSGFNIKTNDTRHKKRQQNAVMQTLRGVLQKRIIAGRTHQQKTPQDQ